MEKTASGVIPIATNQFTATILDSVHVVTLLDERKAQVDDRTYEFSIARSAQGSISLFVNNVVFEIVRSNPVQNDEINSFDLRVNGLLFQVLIEDHRTLVRKSMLKAQPGSSSLHEIKAPMPGKVVRVEVEVGESIKAGTGLVVLEAMKMENEIKAPTDGRVEKILVTSGRAVEKGEILISIKSN